MKNIRIFIWKLCFGGEIFNIFEKACLRNATFCDRCSSSIFCVRRSSLLSSVLFYKQSNSSKLFSYAAFFWIKRFVGHVLHFKFFNKYTQETIYFIAKNYIMEKKIQSVWRIWKICPPGAWVIWTSSCEKVAFAHAQNVRIYIILHMRKVSSGHLFTIKTFYSIQWLFADSECLRTADT